MCNHSLAEQDVEIADGACPICLSEKMSEIISKVRQMRNEVSSNSGIRNQYQDFERFFELAFEIIGDNNSQ